MHFTNNGGGYATLSFIPTLGTMILGLIAGGIFRSDRRPMDKFRWLVVAGAIAVSCGWLLGVTGICPVVKRIWTPSWVLFSDGLAFLFLAGFYLVIDIWNRRAWAFPLVVVGMNSIAAYLIAHLWAGFVFEALPRHFGRGWIELFGKPYEPLILGAAVLTVEWLILYWMNRRKIFLRI
jgi:predicted acyltransferase